MDTRLLSGRAGERVFAVIFETGDDVLDGLRRFTREHDVSAASLSAIGAFEQVTLGYFDVTRREYQRIECREQVEVLALTGNIALGPDGRVVHVHVVLGRADATALGGHLLDARVRPTLEVIVTESPAHLRRRLDPATGLTLIDLNA